MNGEKNRKLILIICKIRLFYLGVVLFCCGMALVLLRDTPLWPILAPSGLVSGKKVVIDAGHGGFDPGAKSAGGLLEKDINLDVALRLKKQLAQVGVYCIMIRERDCDFVELGPAGVSKKRQDLLYRIAVANQSRADLFLSIHANSFPDSYYRGAQTFFNPVSPASKMLAQVIQKHLVAQLGPNRRQARPGDFRVLNDTKMPGITIETGFLSNPHEAGLLADPAYRERIAAAIYDGLIDFWSNCRLKQEKIP